MSALQYLIGYKILIFNSSSLSNAVKSTENENDASLQEDISYFEKTYIPFEENITDFEEDVCHFEKCFVLFRIKCSTFQRSATHFEEHASYFRERCVPLLKLPCFTRGIVYFELMFYSCVSKHYKS